MCTKVTRQCRGVSVENVGVNIGKRVIANFSHLKTTFPNFGCRCCQGGNGGHSGENQTVGALPTKLSTSAVLGQKEWQRRKARELAAKVCMESKK